MVDRSDYKVKTVRLKDSVDEPPVEGTPAERILMVWNLTQEVWGLNQIRDGVKSAESRLQRHIINLYKKKS